LLKGVIGRVMSAAVTLIDSAEETARETATVLLEQCLSAKPGKEPEHRFIASDDPLMFLQLGQRFLGDAIESVEVKTLG
jgi:glutamate racemase